MANSNSSEDRLDKWLEELYTSADEAAADFVNDFPELRCEVQSLITAEREAAADDARHNALEDVGAIGADYPYTTRGLGGYRAGVEEFVFKERKKWHDKLAPQTQREGE
jgi:hypothetical protein